MSLLSLAFARRTGAGGGVVAATGAGAGGLAMGASAAVLISWRGGTGAATGTGAGGLATIGASAAVVTSWRGGAADVVVSFHPVTVGVGAVATDAGDDGSGLG